MFATETWSTYVTVLLIVYALVILFFVIRGMIKTKDINDFAVGSKGFPAWAVGLSLAASMTSAATFIINPGFIALYGFSGVISFGVVMPIAIFASLIFFTKAFQNYGSTVKAVTMAQKAKAHGLSEEEVVQKVMLKKQPVKEFIPGDKIAELALFLAAENASSITGSSYTLDGGWTSQ